MPQDELTARAYCYTKKRVSCKYLTMCRLAGGRSWLLPQHGLVCWPETPHQTSLPHFTVGETEAGGDFRHRFQDKRLREGLCLKGQVRGGGAGGFGGGSAQDLSRTQPRCEPTKGFGLLSYWVRTRWPWGRSQKSQPRRWFLTQVVLAVSLLRSPSSWSVGPGGAQSRGFPECLFYR